MTQQNQRHKIIMGLVGAIGGSILIGLPVLAQVTPRSPEIYQDHTSPADPNSPIYQRSSDSSTQDNSNYRNMRTPDINSDRMNSDNSNAPMYQQSQNTNDPTRYNGNGEVAPNDLNRSPDTNNPGLNQSPANRLSPANTNQNPAARPMDESGYNGSNRRVNGGAMVPGNGNQQGVNGGMMNSSDMNQQPTNRATFSQGNTSSVLNPCPSIFYEAKYRDTVGIPAGCPATNSGAAQ